MGSAPPASAMTLRILSAPAMGSMESTLATTTPSRPSPTTLMPSTTMPRSSNVSPSARWSSPNGAKSRSHERGTSIRRLLKLRDEADVVVVQDAHIRDGIAHLGQAVNPEPEGEPGVLVGIDADGAEHVGVHHPAPAQLDPACVGAGAAAGAETDDTGDLE